MNLAPLGSDLAWGGISGVTVLRRIYRYRGWVWAWALGVYVLGFNGQWLVNSDSAMAAWTGRSLAEGEGFRWPWPSPVPYNPGLPLLFAGSFRIFGEDCFWPVVTVIWGMGVGSLLIAYYLFRRVFGRVLAVVGLLMVGVNAWLHEMALHAMTDTPFVFGTLVMLLGADFLREAIRGPRSIGRIVGGALLLSFGLALMAMFRTVAVTAMAAIAMTMAIWLWRAKPGWVWIKLAVTGIGVAAILLFVWFTVSAADLTYIINRIGRPEVFLTSLITERLPLLLNVHLPYALFGHEMQYIGVALSLASIVSIAYLFRRRTLWGWMAVAFLTQILCFVVLARYFMPIIPLLAVPWVLVSFHVGSSASRLTRPRVGFAITATMMSIWIVSNAIGQIDMIFEQRRLPFYEHYKRGDLAPIFDARPHLRELQPNQIVLVGFRDRGLMAYEIRGGSIEAIYNRDYWQSFKEALNANDLNHVLLAYPERNELQRYVLRAELDIEDGHVFDRPGLVLRRAALPRYTADDADILFIDLIGKRPESPKDRTLVEDLIHRRMYRAELATTLVYDGRFHHGLGTLLGLYMIAERVPDPDEWNQLVANSSWSKTLHQFFEIEEKESDAKFDLERCVRNLQEQRLADPDTNQAIDAITLLNHDQAVKALIELAQGPIWQEKHRLLRLQALALALRGRPLTDQEAEEWESRLNSGYDLVDAAAAFQSDQTPFVP